MNNALFKDVNICTRALQINLPGSSSAEMAG